MQPELELDPVVDTLADPDIEWLNSFLRGELSALETYEQVIDKYGPVQRGIEVLLANKFSHEGRIDRISDQIRLRGGEPAHESGAWGALAKLVEGVATVIGHDAALAILEEGEDHGQKAYERDLEMLTPTARYFVETFLLPEQLATHDAMVDLVEHSN